jgi:DNA-binding NtrC family response regulator
LVVEDEPGMRKALRRELVDFGLDVVEAADGAEGLALLDAQAFDLVLTDFHLPIGDGLSIVRRAATHVPPIPCVFLTGKGTLNDCVSALRAGAFDFMIKPFQSRELRRVVEGALAASPDEKSARAAILGDSKTLHTLLSNIDRVSQQSQPVLFVGEPGSGVDLFVRVLHGVSGRSMHAMLTVRADQPSSVRLLESMLARMDPAHTRGLDEEIGLLFVDEIWRLPVAMQRQIFDLVHTPSHDGEGTWRPGNPEHPPRLVAFSTEPNLVIEERGGVFSPLWRLLSNETIRIPSIRDRYEDLSLLTNYFLERANHLYGRSVYLRRDVVDAMSVYHWPGNVSELASVVERIVLGDEPEVVQLLPVCVRTRNGRDFVRPLSRAQLDALLAQRRSDAAMVRVASRTNQRAWIARAEIEWILAPGPKPAGAIDVQIRLCSGRGLEGATASIDVLDAGTGILQVHTALGVHHIDLRAVGCIEEIQGPC